MAATDPFPPCVIVHEAAEACLALVAGRPVTLLSAPWAGVYGGARWWAGLVAAAARRSGCPEPPHILDCGDAPGRALEALRAGQRRLVLRAPAPVWREIAGRAASLGALLLEAPPDALDLGTREGRFRLAAHLGA